MGKERLAVYDGFQIVREPFDFQGTDEWTPQDMLSARKVGDSGPFIEVDTYKGPKRVVRWSVPKDFGPAELLAHLEGFFSHFPNESFIMDNLDVVVEARTVNELSQEQAPNCSLGPPIYSFERPLTLEDFTDEGFVLEPPYWFRVNSPYGDFYFDPLAIGYIGDDEDLLNPEVRVALKEMVRLSRGELPTQVIDPIFQLAGITV